MKNTFYFLFGVMTTILALFFAVEHYGREVIQDYWIEQLWYGSLEQYYNVSKTIVVAVYLLFIIIWVYKQGSSVTKEINDV